MKIEKNRLLDISKSGSQRPEGAERAAPTSIDQAKETFESLAKSRRLKSKKSLRKLIDEIATFPADEGSLMTPQSSIEVLEYLINVVIPGLDQDELMTELTLQLFQDELDQFKEIEIHLMKNTEPYEPL